MYLCQSSPRVFLFFLQSGLYSHSFILVCASLGFAFSTAWILIVGPQLFSANLTFCCSTWLTLCRQMGSHFFTLLAHLLQSKCFIQENSSSCVRRHLAATGVGLSCSSWHPWMKWWTDCCDQLLPGFKTPRLWVCTTVQVINTSAHPIAGTLTAWRKEVYPPTHQIWRTKTDPWYTAFCLNPRT